MIATNWATSNLSRKFFGLSRRSSPLVLLVFAASVLIGCSAQQSDPFLNSKLTGRRFLYVSSGACYGGGVTTQVGVNTIARYDLDSGNFLNVVYDYNRVNTADSPVGIADYDDSQLAVLIENAAGRRIDLVRKDGTSFSSFYTNAAMLSAVLRGIVKLPDNSFLLSKSSAIEKLSSAKSRVTQGANPYVNAPAAPCAAATTLISGMDVLPSGKIVFAHAAATPNNKFSVISSTGYAAAGDCLAAQAGPTTTALPTAVLAHSSGKVLVAYGSTTTASNSIYSYTINGSTGAISGATAAYTDTSVINGISSMVEDPLSNDVIVANGTNFFSNIERFSFDRNTGLLTRKTSSAYISATVHTRCVSSMRVAN